MAYRGWEQALRTIAALPEDGWTETDWDSFVMARVAAASEVAKIDRERVREDERKARKAEREQNGGYQKPKGRLRAESPKRVAERGERSEMRAEVIGRAGGRCEGPGRGLPGRCGSLPERTGLEVHEFLQRSTHPGSHLDAGSAVALCPVHHEMCTSPVGEMRALVEDAGLLERATS